MMPVIRATFALAATGAAIFFRRLQLLTQALRIYSAAADCRYADDFLAGIPSVLQAASRIKDKPNAFSEGGSILR